LDQTSSALFSLKPVTFRYKPEYDKSGTPHYGLIAEEVAEVSPDLVTHNAKGQLSTVRYEAVNAMLLNEFLKEHKTVQEQRAIITQQRKDFEAAIAQQQKQFEALTATVKEQAAQIEKVSAQLELSKAAPQTVLNNQ
jgi:septal ring factor EnvC (AmiA/AmiB activator)